MRNAKPVLLADWEDVLFVHFSVDADALAAIVPFELDLHDGVAYVSLVAFTQNRLRPVRGGRLAAMLSTPVARHEFLNLRAYVRVNDEPGIYFISEWIPNRLAVLLGPALYGLPYQLGRLRYRLSMSDAPMRCDVATRRGAVRMRANLPRAVHLRPAAPGSLDHFLLERYVGWTHRAGVSRRFNVAHEPWPQTPVGVDLLDRSLLVSQGDCFADARLVAANYSPGVCDVGISAPRIAQTPNHFSASARSAVA